MNLSKHFTLEELTKSVTAKNRKIDNTPSSDIIKELIKLCTQILEPLREAWGAPLIISSGYRSSKLNTAIGGSRTSQHCKGQAADVSTVNDSIEDNKKLFNLAVRLMKEGKIKVGQIIDEYNYNWVHISLPYTKVNQVLHLK